MTTATTARADQLREDKAEAERQMGIHPTGSPVWSIHMAKHPDLDTLGHHLDLAFRSNA